MKNIKELLNNASIYTWTGILTLSITEDTLFIQLNKHQNLPQFQLSKEHDLTSVITSHIAHILFRQPLLLPAERNAFILTYKLLKNNQRQSFRYITQKQIKILRKQVDIIYPKPIEDFLDFLVDVETPITEQKFQQLAYDIEYYIQNKNKTYFEQMTLGRELKIKVKRGFDIDLHNASSSIKQLAPLLLYLRYRAISSDFLIIDEPELGLHPESQAKLLEALAIMVNLGIRVLITTHSPYFMSHLNNIVSGEINNPEILKQQASSLYMNDSRAFLSMEQVSAYEMKRNKLRSLKDKDFGIRWDTLSDVSADIQQKYFEIHEKKEMFSNGKK